jgi:hypothetical protein
MGLNSTYAKSKMLVQEREELELATLYHTQRRASFSFEQERGAVFSFEQERKVSWSTRPSSMIRFAREDT